MAKAPCVWHRHRVTRKYREVSRDSKGNRRTSTREEVMTENVTPDAFVLRDGQGEITIVPSGEVDGARKTLSEFREENQDRTEVKIGSFSFSFAGGGDGDTLGYEYEEWVLPPDTAIFVQGEASDRDGALQVAKPEGKGDLFISTKSETDLLKDASHDARLYGVLAAVAAVGAVVLVVLAVRALKRALASLHVRCRRDPRCRLRHQVRCVGQQGAAHVARRTGAGLVDPRRARAARRTPRGAGREAR